MLLASSATQNGSERSISRMHLPQLDGLRGIAILAVISHHFGFHPPSWIDWGPVGPNLFFALSGYLITVSLWKLREKGDIKGLGFGWLLAKFHAHRIVRLLPPIVVLLILGGAWGLPEYRSTWMWHITFLTNMFIVWNDTWVGSLSHFWSLSVQEQFYLLWPLVLLVPRVCFPWAMLGVIIFAGLFRLDYILEGRSELARWFLLPASLDAFAAGGLVAWMQVRGWGGVARSRKWAWLPWGGAVGALAFSRYLRFLPDTHPGTAAVEWFECLFFCWLLLCLVEAPQSWTVRFLAITPLRFVGKVSYGVYVFHALIAVVFASWLDAVGLHAEQHSLLRTLVLSAISIAVATASWKWFEQPLRDQIQKWYQPLDEWASRMAIGFRALLNKGNGEPSGT